MRNFSRFCRKYVAASMLVLVLAYSTLAGEMQYPGVTAPPPAPVNGDTQFPGAASPSETADGDIQFPGAAVDSVTGMAVTLWQSAMALF